MSRFTERNLLQKAIYWAPDEKDGRGGWTYLDAEEIDVRWVDKTTVLEASDGSQFISNAVVRTNQDLEKFGMLLLGRLHELDSDEIDNPKRAGAKPIKKFDKVPSIKATSYVRKAYL